VRTETTTTPDDLLASRFRLVCRLADDLAHEIKNPIHSMVINLEVLRRQVLKNSADAALERADVVEIELRRVHQLIDQVLLLLRPEREPPRLLDLNECIYEILPLVHAKLRAARGQLHFDLERDIPLPAFGQKQPFKLAVLALLEHALPGETGPGADLTIDTSRLDGAIRVSLRLAPAAGPVLDEDFDGIAIARALLRTLDGEVRIESTADGNTAAFDILLPAHAAA
jgi:nitrogen-specific signal transduction histidine kinase